MGLSLTRKVNEKIMIGNDIAITVRKIKEGQVILSLDAPSHLKILRQELLDRGNNEEKHKLSNI